MTFSMSSAGVHFGFMSVAGRSAILTESSMKLARIMRQVLLEREALRIIELSGEKRETPLERE
jgi:hypothetical protein